MVMVGIFNHVIFICIICFIFIFYWPSKSSLGEWFIKMPVIFLIVYLYPVHTNMVNMSKSGLTYNVKN